MFVVRNNNSGLEFKSTKSILNFSMMVCVGFDCRLMKMLACSMRFSSPTSRLHRNNSAISFSLNVLFRHGGIYIGL
jgi:hypothetical protein